MILFVSAATAQQPAVPDLNAQLYRPPVDARATLWAESAGTIVDGFEPIPAVALHYVNRPLVYLRDDGVLTALVSDVLQLDAILGTAYDRFRLAVDAPVFLYAAGEVSGSAQGLGDIALDGRVTVLDPAELPLGLAIDGRISFPTGTVAGLGDDGVGAEITAVGEQRFPRGPAGSDPAGGSVVVVENVGARIAPASTLENAEVDDQFVARLGLGYRFGDAGGISADVASRLTVEDLANPAAIPTEALLGGSIRLTDDFVLRLGAGRGITPGIGSPVARGVAMIASDRLPVRDRDLDGIVDTADGCPDEPEDRDEFEDVDGCPDPDNDQDKLVDTVDRCPNDPEDPDSFRDDDGCPDPSSQVEVVAQDPAGNAIPARIQVSGVQDAFGDGTVLADLHDGAYEAVGDLQGYVTARVSFTAPRPEPVVLSMQPAVPLGVLALTVLGEEGAPVSGSVWTLDGVPGAPLVDGTIVVKVPEGAHKVGAAAEGLLPATQDVKIYADKRTDEVLVLRRPRVTVTVERVDVQGTILFETGKAIIKKESWSLLEEVASTLVAHPEVKKIRIEGHTDSRGSASANQALSEKRAAAVRDFLQQHGVAAERMASVGFGESRPVDPREVPEAWDKNRRVDFFIEERS